MLRHLLIALLGLICCLRTSAQCTDQKLFPSVYVELPQKVSKLSVYADLRAKMNLSKYC